MSIKVVVKPYENVGSALRRFKKIIERSGILREARRHQHYQKPSEARRIAVSRKKRAIAQAKLPPKKEYPPEQNYNGR